MTRTTRRIAPLALAAIAPLAACQGIERAAGVPTHYVSHQLCSATFVGGLDPEAFYRQGIEPVVAPAGGLISRRIDRASGVVEADLAGLAHSRAVYRPGRGCTIVRDGPPPAPIALDPPAAPPLLAPIAGPEAVAPSDPALAAALDRAFADPTNGTPRWTKAVVVVRHGRIVAERYAPGFGVDTPMMGWSMTKSVVNALLGVLVRQGRLSMDEPAPVAAWSGPDDPRRSITLDQLLRMTSGLDIGQSLTSSWTSAFDLSSQMEFDMADMAGFAEQARPAAAPGERWRYTNGNTMILSRIIRDNTGGDAASVARFAHRELFDKLGMTSVTLEFDAAGTPIGSSHMWASARDWARFGLLYLNDGVVGGERILPPGWVAYSARLTPGSEDFGYGAGFWTNRGDSRAARRRVGAGMPADAFMARGSQGQYVVIVPSEDLVVVRMGMANDVRGDLTGVERLVADVLADRPADSRAPAIAAARS